MIEEFITEITAKFHSHKIEAKFNQMEFTAPEVLSRESAKQREYKVMLNHLQSKQDIIIARTFEYDQIKDFAKVKTEKLPARNKVCPCGSLAMHKKCCEAKDFVKKFKVMNKLHDLIEQSQAKAKPQTGPSDFILV